MLNGKVTTIGDEFIVDWYHSTLFYYELATRPSLALVYQNKIGIYLGISSEPCKILKLNIHETLIQKSCYNP